MEEEQKLCLAEALLELMEIGLLQVQMQLLEEMQDLEALEAEVEAEATEVMVIMFQVFLLDQQQMEVKAEREVMEAVAEEGATEDGLLIALREQEVQEVLAVLEEGVEAAEMVGLLQLVGQEIVVVMVQQEAMAEEGEEEGLIVIEEILVAAALVALD